MTSVEMSVCAFMWLNGSTTMEMSKKLDVPEFEIYNRLGAIKSLAMRARP